MIRQYLKFLAPSILTFGLGTLAFHLTLGGEVYLYVWLAFIYHTCLTLAAAFMLSKAKKKDGFAFTSASMGVSMGRLLLSAAVLFGYYMYLKIDVMTFTLAFFVYYFAYLAGEVRFIKKMEG